MSTLPITGTSVQCIQEFSLEGRCRFYENINYVLYKLETFLGFYVIVKKVTLPYVGTPLVTDDNMFE